MNKEEKERKSVMERDGGEGGGFSLCEQAPLHCLQEGARLPVMWR